MSSITRVFSAIFLLLAVFAAGAVVSAQEAAAPAPKPEKKEWKKARSHRPHSYMRFRKPSIMREIRRLDLSDAQKQQVKIVLENMGPDEATRTEMRTIMQAKADGTATEEQNARLKVLHEQRKQNDELIRIQIEALLTPEQKQKLEARRAERLKRMEERRKMREARKQSQGA